jgi:hypothetical protein
MARLSSEKRLFSAVCGGRVGQRPDAGHGVGCVEFEGFEDPDASRARVPMPCPGRTRRHQHHAVGVIGWSAPMLVHFRRQPCRPVVLELR